MSSVEIPDWLTKWVVPALLMALFGLFWLNFTSQGDETKGAVNQLNTLSQNVVLIQRDIAQINLNGTEQSQQNRKMIDECFKRIEFQESRLREIERVIDRMAK